MHFPKSTLNTKVNSVNSGCTKAWVDTYTQTDKYLLALSKTDKEVDLGAILSKMEIDTKASIKIMSHVDSVLKYLHLAAKCLQNTRKIHQMEWEYFISQTEVNF